jgi:dTDP-4-dehydrorhamnose 3,5-epimerase
MSTTESQIEGVVMKSMARYTDKRGWLIELYRDDELPEGFKPVMGYISVTLPGIARGPHEHVNQTDGFIFLYGKMELHLWESREGKGDRHEIHVVGKDNPIFVTVPPGVVHAYRNVGEEDGMVLNFPDQLYAGWGKKEPVDEIRHEEETESRYKF